MEIIDNRNEQQRMISEATYYFNKNGLTCNFEKFFNSDAVKKVLQEVYVRFTADAEKIVSNLPGPAQKRGNQIFATIPEKEASYVEDVKNSFLCTIANLLNDIDYFVTVNNAIIDEFNVAFDTDPDGKMLKALYRIADELAKILLDEFLAIVNLPSGLPDEVAQVLFAISGGTPMMSLAEIEEYMAENPSADGKGETK